MCSSSVAMSSRRLIRRMRRVFVNILDKYEFPTENHKMASKLRKNWRRSQSITEEYPFDLAMVVDFKVTNHACSPGFFLSFGSFISFSSVGATGFWFFFFLMFFCWLPFCKCTALHCAIQMKKDDACISRHLPIDAHPPTVNGRTWSATLQ